MIGKKLCNLVQNCTKFLHSEFQFKFYEVTFFSFSNLFLAKIVNTQKIEC